MNATKFGSVLILFLLVVFACKREESTRWNIDITAPIAHGKLQIDDLVPAENINTDSEGLVHFVIEEELTDFNVDSLMEIPDTTFYDYMSNTFATITIQPGGLILPQESGDAEMDIPNVQLRELISSGGQLKYRLRNMVNGNLLATYALPKATLNGESIFIEESMPPGLPNDPSIVDGTYDLTGYHFDLSGVDEDSYNQMFNAVGLYVHPDADGPVAIPVQDTLITTDIKFIDPSIYYARGYFGQHDIDVEEVTKLDMLSNIVSGNLYIDGVDLDIVVSNYAGIDAQIELNHLIGRNTTTSSEILLDHPDLYSTINLTRAIDNNGLVTPSVYSISMDEINSNIDTWLENLPDSLVTSASIQVNPLGDVSSGNDFIYTDQALEAKLSLDLPLCVELDELLLRDTLNLSADTEIQVSGYVQVSIENAFPFQGVLSLKLLSPEGDEDMVLLDNAQLEQGMPQPDFMNIQPGTSTWLIEVDQQLLDALKTNDQMEVEIMLDTYGEQEVKFTSANYMDVRVHYIGQAEIEVE